MDMQTTSPFEILQMLLDNIFILALILLLTEKSVPHENLIFKINKKIIKTVSRLKGAHFM